MTPRSIILAFFVIIISVIDAKTLKIPNYLLFLCLFLLFAFDIWNFTDFRFLFGNIITAFIWFFIFYLVYRRSEGIGFGDVKYAALLGYALGLEKSCAAFLCTAVAAMAVYSIGIGVFRWSTSAKLPFAPFLGFGILALECVWRAV